MEFRIEAAACCLMMLWPLAAAEFPARHEHTHGACSGTLTIDERGVSYRETDGRNRKRPHDWSWAWQNVQQFELAPKQIRVLTYHDRAWKLGADREYTFRGDDFTPAYALLKDRLDQRLIAELGDTGFKPLWQVPVKRLGTIRGSEGTLLVGADRIVFTSPRGARTWRFADIDSLSTSGPFSLTLTTYERARLQYGSRKEFNFQLKESLAEARYDDLWRRIHSKEKQP